MKNLILKRYKKSGFTLTELLIVTATIGVLAAVSIPIFMKAHRKAIEAVNLSNIRSAMSTAYAESIFDDVKPLYFVYDTSTGRLTGDSGKGFDKSLPESTDLTKERYENIYVCINDGKIKTWPALPDGYLESHANADGPDRSLAIPLSDGRYKVQPGDWLKIDGHWYRYVGTKEMTVDGSGTRKGKKYWERVE